MKTTATINPRKLPWTFSTTHSLLRANRASLPTAQIGERSSTHKVGVFAAPGIMHDFSQIPVSPEEETTTACPIGLAPTRCPFGGACHVCPDDVQAELGVGSQDSRYEQEADRASEEVMRMAQPAGIKRGNGNRIRLSQIGGQASVLQRRDAPTGIRIAEAKPFGHQDLKSEELKQKRRTYIGSTTLMQVTPGGNYKGHCTKEYLTEVANTCPPRFKTLRPKGFCEESKCLEFGRYGIAGDGETGNLVTDGPDTFIDRHRTHHSESLLEGTGKDACSVVCHQRYAFDRKDNLGSFYIIRNFRSGQYAPPGEKTVHITTGEIRKVPASLTSPSRAEFAEKIAPGLVKQGVLAEAPPVPSGEVQPKSDRSAVMPASAPPVVYEVLRSQGSPLDRALCAQMGSCFGHDFTRVRVHHDAKAAESADALNALAYTVGESVVFGENQYAPCTNAGIKLLIHELAHVVQQSAQPDSPMPIMRQKNPAVASGMEWKDLSPKAQRAIDQTHYDRGLKPDEQSAFRAVYIALESRGLWNEVVHVFDVFPRNVRGIRATVKPGFAVLLMSNPSFCRDTGIGGSRHAGSVTWREVAKAGTEGLHIGLSSPNRMSAHLDTVAPVAGRESDGACRYSPSHVLSHITRDLLGWRRIELLPPPTAETRPGDVQTLTRFTIPGT